MVLIEWLPQFEIGIPEVDYEHRRMIELLNRLHARLADDAPKEEIDSFLGEVHSGISAHFALEEMTMRKMAYDEFDAHKMEHEQLLDDISDIMDTFDADAYFDYGGSLAEGLRTWFIEHFQTMDSRLHHFVQGAS